MYNRTLVVVLAVFAISAAAFAMIPLRHVLAAAPAAGAEPEVGDPPMYIQFVKLRPGLSEEDVLRVSEERAPRFRATPGLLQKYYAREPGSGEFAGIYIWESEKALLAFQDSELRSSIPEAYRLAGAPRVEVFEILFPLYPLEE
jgi:heme-degrading monooxygenase HmoA